LLLQASRDFFSLPSFLVVGRFVPPVRLFFFKKYGLVCSEEGMEASTGGRRGREKEGEGGERLFYGDVM
jgi:hypothetical protein